MLNIKINGKDYNAEDGETILDVSKRNGYHIPTLCHLDLHDINYCNHPVSCRVCMVEVDEGRGKRLVPACDTYVTEGMQISTDSINAIKSRRTVMELLLSNHPQDCLYCERNTNCDLQQLANDLAVRGNRFEGKSCEYGKDTSSKSIVKNLDKCILCRRCESICSEVQTVDIYSPINRGFETTMAPAFNDSLQETACTFCGQCVSVCPTAALTEVNKVNELWSALNNPDVTVVVQVAPAVRVAIGEEFGGQAGEVTTGKMVSAIKRLGFDYVFDTNCGADLTILEEANEVVDRLQNGGRLPILTSCCPAWIKFIEHQFPNLVDIPSTCKSPHEMLGAIIKSYFAKVQKIDPSKIFSVSVMPCVAKKYEAAREELNADGYQDVDLVITTRELAAMIKEAGINYFQLDDETYDNPLGDSTGAAAIFGSTGGVLEAALRTVSAWLNDGKVGGVGQDGGNAPSLDFKDVRGLDGIKEASIDAGGTTLKVAAASGLGNARKLLEAIESGKCEYHVIEIMACPSGCIAGGGQPYNHGNREIIKQRMRAIYGIDSDSKIRESHKNPDIIKLYKDFLGEPGGHTAHKLLHTHYIEREIVCKRQG